MNIKVNRLNKVEEGKVKAFVDLIFEGSLIVKGFKVVEGQSELFVGFPSTKGKDGEFFSSVQVLDTETKRQITSVVLKEYHND